MIQTRVGAKVSCADGWVGTLAQYVRDPGTGKATHLVVETGQSKGRATVPVNHIMAVGYDTVFLDLSSRQLRAFG